MNFHFFQSKKQSELESIIRSLVANMSNNYKDNAQSNLKELQEKYKELLDLGKLNEKQKAYYDEIIGIYVGEMKEFTHKDQKPYWT